MLRANLERRAQPLVVVRRRESDVDNRDVRRVAPHFEQKVIRIVALREDLEARVAKKPPDALSQEHAVFGNRY
jgi:hypothetical protein